MSKVTNKRDIPKAILALSPRQLARILKLPDAVDIVSVRMDHSNEAIEVKLYNVGSLVPDSCQIPRTYLDELPQLLETVVQS